MPSLQIHAKGLTEDKKISHILSLLEKAKSKNGDSLGLKYIHSLRIDCIFLAYFGHSIPQEVYEKKMEVFPFEIDENKVTDEERPHFDGYRRAREIMYVDWTNTTLYDITDKEFHLYRRKMWKQKEEKGGWKYVENKRFKRR